ncbi:MAG: AAA family ATPase [Eubacterium sp.]|nr:AAA family ATPase [Eubacterium sp.]
MLTRKVEEKLIKWKDDRTTRSLMIRGARQVGKTYVIEKFARENYKHHITINFVEKPTYKEIFKESLSVDDILMQISFRVRDVELVPHETLIFLDEIQECPEARAALKFFSMDDRYDVIASGSMLGIHHKSMPSYPVGYVDYIDMHSLDFEEFLWACGITEENIQTLREHYENREPLPDSMHEEYMKLFRKYIVIGGMPYVVQDFVDHNDFSKVFRIQNEILSDYLDDIAKYATGAEKTKARACFLSIPKHLAKDYKKFRYSLIEAKGTYRKFGGSLEWLADAGIISFCYNLANLELPLEGNAKSDCFKVYMRDTGLLTAMLEEGSVEDILDGNLGIYKGAIYENIVADIFTKSEKKLYYYEKDSKLEMDFIIRYNKQLTAVEVKSSEKNTSKSMTSIIQNHGVKHGIKLSSKNLSSNDTVDTLPLYMAMFI